MYYQKNKKNDFTLSKSAKGKYKYSCTSESAVLYSNFKHAYKDIFNQHRK